MQGNGGMIREQRWCSCVGCQPQQNKRRNMNQEEQQCCVYKHPAIHKAFQMDTQIKEITEGIVSRRCTYYLNEWLESLL